MKTIVVSGYATLDYVIQLDAEFHGTGTVTGQLGPSGAWPRAGGAVLYTSKRLAAAGHRAYALTWIGDDGDGGHYLRACQKAKICCEAIDQTPATRTPRCVMVYNPDGDYGCLLDTGLAGSEKVSDAQLHILQSADLLCVSVGPPQATEALINAVSPNTDVAWIAKRDLAALPLALRQKIANKARYIFCNADEREFVTGSFASPRRPDQIIIETLGSAGVLIDTLDERIVLPAEFVETNDATGAGDTLAGETLAQLLSENVTLEEAVKRGMSAARLLLSQRQSPASVTPHGN